MGVAYRGKQCFFFASAGVLLRDRSSTGGGGGRDWGERSSTRVGVLLKGKQVFTGVGWHGYRKKFFLLV